jgi:ribosomal protein S18 acetylase RimI-like enzyme
MDRAAPAIVEAAHDDIPTVRRVAERIWRTYYPGIVPLPQIDYMLARGYSDESLAKFVREDGAGLALARVDDEIVGFAAWLRPGEPATTKLDKLYVLPERHGHGLGRLLIAHVEAAGRRDGSRTLILNVAKKNAKAIGFYRAYGFEVREATVVDIGGGFAMDDYILAKPL